MLSLLLFNSIAYPQEKNPEQNQLNHMKLLVNALTCISMNEEFISRMANYKEISAIIGQTPPPITDRLLEQAVERGSHYSTILSAILGEIIQTKRLTEEQLIDYITEFRIGMLIGFKQVSATDTFVSNLSKILLECDEAINAMQRN